MINGISHVTFIVKDLERTAVFLEKVFEAKEVYSRDLAVKYFLIGDLWIALNKGAPLKERTYNHIAFHVSQDDLDKYIKRVRDIGLEIEPERPSRTRIAGEGRSIYFYDFDNHLFELHTGTLPERLAAYSQT
jgi:catechol 2,3-dioxygenase-like lactoylglutathione lyase family enzyme